MKQKSFSLLIVILLCISNTSFATTPTVGEGVWNVATRIASELVDISIIKPSCNFFILQEDIGDGGIFTITKNNASYCLEENITFTFGSAIVIAGSGITLNLNGKLINGQNFETTGIELAGGVENVVIKNGVITGIGGTAPNGAAIRDSENHAAELKGIIIKDIHFRDNNRAIDFSNATSPTSDARELLIDNCHLFDSGGISIVGASGIIQNCEINEFRGDSFVGGIQLTGPATSIAESFIVQDCIATTSFGSNSNQISVERTENVIIQNCSVQGSPSDGFSISACNDVLIRNCIAQGSEASGNGFIVQNPLSLGTVLIEDAKAMRFETGIACYLIPESEAFASAQLIGCVAQENNGNGFIASPIASMIQGCSAIGNSGNGFFIDVGLAGPRLTNIRFEECSAHGNYGDGFAIVSTNSFASVTGNVTYLNCIAQNNKGTYYDESINMAFEGNGFSVGTSRQNVSTIWIYEPNNTLATYDVLSQTFTIVGNNLPAIMNDIAFSPDGTLYATSFSPTSSLFSIDPATSNGVVLAQLSPSPLNGGNRGLTCNSNGTIYMTSQTDLTTVDPITGAITTLGTMGASVFGETLAFLNTNLYMTSVFNFFRLVDYEPPTGSSVISGIIPTSGLATLCINGEFQLWGVSRSGAPVTVYRIDPATGAVSDTRMLPTPAEGGINSASGATSLIPSIQNIIFKECIAQGNSSAGFYFAPLSENIKVFDCLSSNNTGTGFNDLGQSGANYIMGCMAVGNGYDFNNIKDPTQLISYNLPGAINGIGRFINVSS